MRKISLLIALLIALPAVNSLGYTDNAQEEIYGVAVDENGDVVVVGQHFDGDKFVMRTEKYDGETGAVLWRADFDKYTQNIGKAVIIDSNGNIYAGGIVGGGIGDIQIPSTDYIIIKYDKNGNKIWSKTYDNGFADFLMDMGMDNDGNIYATGMTLYFDITSQNLSNIDYWTIKVSPTNGNILKEDKYDESMDAAFGMDVEGDTIIVAGTVQESSQESKYCIVKYDKDLSVKKVTYYSKGMCSASDVAILSNGYVAVTGSRDEDFFTILYDTNWNIRSGWPKRVENGEKDDALGVAVDSQNNIIVAGYMSKNLQRKWYFIKYGIGGNKIFDKLEEGINGEIKRVAIDSQNNIIVAGYKMVGGSEYFCVRKYSPDGDLIWEGGGTPSEPTHANFIWLPEEPTRADVVHFYDKSTGDITAWHWDFGDGATSNEQNPVHQYSKVGTYNVTLTVTGVGIEDSIAKQLTISNSLPDADFTYIPSNPLEGQKILFDGSVSHDRDGSIISYEWDFGDGNKSSGIKVNHTYANEGNYTVTLTVKDNDGGEGKISKLVIVNPEGANIPPVAHFKIKKHAGKGEEVTANASQSYDEDGSITFYKWDWDGDGKIDETKLNSIAVHTWYQEGEYQVTLIVEDDKGYQTAYTQKVVIGGIPQLIIETPQSISLDKGEEKSINVVISCLNESLYFLNFSFDIEDGKDISVTPLATNFNISSGETKEIPIKVVANEKGEIKIKIIGKDIEKDILIESNLENIFLNLKGGSTPSFTFIALIAAIALSMLLLKKKR